MKSRRKHKAKHDGPLHIDLPFDEAMRRVFKVKEPKGGWKTLGKPAKRRARPTKARRRKAG